MAAVNSRFLAGRRAQLMGALLMAVLPLHAQTGSVRITVVDPNDARVVSAKATLQARGDKLPQIKKADWKGEILFGQLPPGKYEITIDAQGFRRKRLTVIVKNGSETQIKTELSVAAYP